MKLPIHIKEANLIGADSYELQHFTQLPLNASREDQITALERDISWQKDHVDEITRGIEDLIGAIRDGYKL